MNYPKDIRQNLIFRNELVLACIEKPELASAIKSEFEKDILFAFNVFFWTHDTRTKEKDLPFVTYGFQDEAILKLNEAIERGENVFVDKSRDMGATYIVLYTFLWRWLTKKGELFRLGSRKEQFVDQAGDMDTHFEKIRYCLGRLPKFLMPKGFDKKKHSNTMRLLNPELKSTFIGEATNANFGRGGRNKAILFDEFQSWENDQAAWRAATDATPCKVALGTPQGSGNKFAELARTSEIKNKIRLMWHKHPRKVGITESHIKDIEKGEVFDRVGKYTVVAKEINYESGLYVDQFGKIRSNWYDRQHLEREADDIAENIDCSYLTTGNPVFDVLICDQRLRDCKEPIEIGNLYWKVKPVYDEFGNVVNKDQLEVGFLKNYAGLYKIWEHPVGDWQDGYCISADVAEGLEQGDFNSASCLRRFPKQGQHTEDFKPKVVATLHGHVRPEEYREELWKFAVYYKMAWLAPERTGLGLSVITGLVEVYQKLYHKEVITKGYAETTDKIGWDTSNHNVKKLICTNLSKLISHNGFEDLDEGFWKETFTFVNDDGKYEAQGKSRGEKCFDDRVMDRAILLYVNENLPAPYRKPEEETYLGRPMRSRQRQVNSLVGWI